MPKPKREELESHSKIRNRLREFKPNITESSLNSYMTNLIKFEKILGEPLSPELFTEDPEKVKAKFEAEGYTQATLKNKFATVINYLRMYDEPYQKYTDFCDIITGKLSKVQATMEKSGKEAENWLTKQELIDYLEKLRVDLPKVPRSYGDLHRFQKFLTLLFHLNYPLRNELADAVITTNPDTSDPLKNYFTVNLKKKTVKASIQNYKTKKTYNTIELNLIPSVANEFIKYYKFLDTYKKAENINNDWLLISKDGQKLTRNDYTRFVQSIFSFTDKNISTTMIRKIIVSDLYDVKKIKELSSIMGHSPGLQLSTYAKE
jgi:hypothetical protein